MSRREQSAIAVRMLSSSMVRREGQTYPNEHALPERSRLYGMAPCGEGMFSESLTSYLNRLGWKHGVPPRWLVAQEMIPYLSRAYGLTGLNSFCQQRAMVLNGNGSLALEWSLLLERLTGRSDLCRLTLHGWIGDLSDRGHLRVTPA